LAPVGPANLLTQGQILSPSSHLLVRKASVVCGDPSSLTLYADPTGLTPGLTYAALVTIVKPASGDSPEQSVNIPVSLSIGDVWNVNPAQKIYLPIIIRPR